LRLFETKTLGDFRRQPLNLDAEPTALDAPMRLQLSDDGLATLEGMVKPMPIEPPLARISQTG
jgi:hypothetical protein